MLFRLTIPPDVHFGPTLRLIAERVAQCAGYSSAEAARVASSVAQAAEVVLARTPCGKDSHRPIDIRFEREGIYLDVWLRFPASESERTQAADPALSSEAMRQGMDSVEFGREGDTLFCRLRRALPHEKVDHQCEMPPPETH